MNTRLERILIKLTRQYAPHLLPMGWEQGDAAQREAKLARRLASYNLLVLVGQVPDALMQSRETLIQNWVNEYGSLYSLLAQTLFPSFMGLSAQYADDKHPAIVVVRGEATPVMHVLAGFVTPYIAIRQAQNLISDVELLGLMDVVLDELEAHDLPREQYNALRAEGAAILKRALLSPVRQIGVTPFDRPILGQIPKTGRLSSQPKPPEKLPEQPRPPDKDLPFELPRLEEDPDDVPTPTEQLFRTSIPMFFAGDRGSKRRPPVPGLPGDKNPKPKKD